MVKEEPTRVMQKRFRQAGWKPIRSVGSHTVWASPTGTKFTLPDGHRTISPGVVRKANKALEEG